METKLKKAEIISIIKNDANTRLRYFGDKPGKCCVIGGLLTAAGCSEKLKKELKETPGVGVYACSNSISEATMLLTKRYGLTLEEMSCLQKINDETRTTSNRRKKLIEAVESFRVFSESRLT